MRPIAVIPARGNSQRLPQKNLRRLGGKPLTQWAIEAARACDLFGKAIYVTTDDDAVVRLARSLGVTVLSRQAHTARNDATLEHVVLEVRSQLETRAPLYLLTPTSPFRNPATMRQAWAYYAMHDRVGRVVSVIPYHDPPHWALALASGEAGEVRPVFPADFARPRTELPRCVQQDGSHVIMGHNGGATVAFQVPPEESLDINTQSDLDYAEFLLSRGRVEWIANRS